MNGAAKLQQKIAGSHQFLYLVLVCFLGNLVEANDHGTPLQSSHFLPLPLLLSYCVPVEC